MMHTKRKPLLVKFFIGSWGWAFVIAVGLSSPCAWGQMMAGASKVDITHRDAGPVNDPLHARALILKSGSTTVVLVSLDVVSIGEIGQIKKNFLPNLRSRVQRELSIPPSSLIVNASHCHGIPCTDVEDRTFQAIQQAHQNLVPVNIGVGFGHEDRIMENRRLKLKSGREADVRHAYSLPPDEEVAAVGPVDTQIGVLRLDRQDGRTLALLYNFACHPIQSVPGGANTADITGFSSKVIEDNLSEGAIALFVQGCGGDINPIAYKHVDIPRHAEPLGNMLGLSTLLAARKIQCKADDRLVLFNEPLAVPRSDNATMITALEAEQQRLLQSLGGTSLNLKTFLPLVVKYNLSDEFPAYYSHAYMHEAALGRSDLRHLDAQNRSNMKQYIQNIHTMEQLTRNQINLALLRKHQASMLASGKRTLDVEVCGLRIGDMVLVTFPGELTVEIGLGIKKTSPHPHTFVAGYTNGYIYYSPTAEQLKNVGRAQEDSDCLLAPEWQAIFESKVAQLLNKL